nr:anti-sigma factor [Mycobacteroides abscessus]
MVVSRRARTNFLLCPGSASDARDHGGLGGKHRNRASRPAPRTATQDCGAGRAKRYQNNEYHPLEGALVAVAAATAIGLAAAGIGAIMWPPTPTAQQVFTATDVRTVTGAIPTGGTATVVYSRQKNTAVLVMNNVAPPRPGTVYQMWLIGDREPQSAGTMDAQAVAPSTTAVISRLNGSTALAFTVENGQGSTTPTGTLIAQLPLNY